MQSLAPADPDVREFETVVEAVDGRDVRLTETYFYPESGGQPADRGTIDGIAVVDVRETPDGVVHRLAEAPAVAAGEAVLGVVDDAFRTYCMRAHTASHALYGAGRRLFDDLGYGGFDIDPEKVRVDLATPTDIDDEALVELERLTNRAVWESRDVSWGQRGVAAAREDERVAFNTKTEEGVMADADSVRVVTIDGWDWAACGGTHVPNTREIGPVTVLDRSNPGEGLTRVEFAVGPTAIDRRAEDHRAARAAARELGTGVADLPEVTASLRAERDALESDLADLRAEVLAARLAAFDVVERDGATVRLGVVSDFGPNDVADPAREAVDDETDAAVVVGRDGRTFVVVASDGGLDAGAVVEGVTDEFGGGGGGSPTFAQGGGIDADPDDVVAFLRE
jgi:alanyl-tRNA synthetase